MKPLVLPWKGELVPHVILDITRSCNIRCEACYNHRDFHKSVDQVMEDLDAAQRQRRLHTVTLSGGEPTLHPELLDIVARIHARKLRTVVFTNGLTLDDSTLGELRRAGLDTLLLHIDRGQQRPDLGDRPSADQVDDLRRQRVALCAANGVQVGLVCTIYRRYLDDVLRAVDLVHRSPHTHFLLVTCQWDASRFRGVRGSLAEGFRVAPELPEVAGADNLSLDEIGTMMQRQGLHPFGQLGSSADPAERRWLCYTNAVVARNGDPRPPFSLTSALSDRLLIRLVRVLTGHYIYHVRQNSVRFGVQMLLNGLSGGRFLGNSRTLAAALMPGATLYEKRIVFQRGPSIGPEGNVVHCSHCPDATIVRGKFVPVCICDDYEG